MTKYEKRLLEHDIAFLKRDVEMRKYGVPYAKGVYARILRRLEARRPRLPDRPK